MTMTPTGAEMLAAQLVQTAFQSAAIERKEIFPRSGDENEFFAKGDRDGSSGFQQSFQMSFGRLLKPKDGLSAVRAVGVTAWEKERFGNPDTVFV